MLTTSVIVLLIIILGLVWTIKLGYEKASTLLRSLNRTDFHGSCKPRCIVFFIFLFPMND